MSGQEPRTFGLNPILDELEELKEQQYESQVFEDYNEQYMYFFGIALVFMLLEFFVGNLKSRRKLFSLMAVIVLSLFATFGTDRPFRSEKGKQIIQQGEL